jgi:[ribosomal protein S18]-alanine N-acetyltransferase
VAVIRAMSRADLDAVVLLEKSTPEAPHWERSAYEGFLSKDDPAKQTFVVEQGGRLVGFVAARIVVDVCELESIAVAASARRVGLGTALLETLVYWARQQGASRVQLEVRHGNDATIMFYKRNGFIKDGLRRGYYRDPEEDALLMSLTLKPEQVR